MEKYNKLQGRLYGLLLGVSYEFIDMTVCVTDVTNFLDKLRKINWFKNSGIPNSIMVQLSRQKSKTFIMN